MSISSLNVPDFSRQLNLAAINGQSLTVYQQSNGFHAPIPVAGFSKTQEGESCTIQFLAMPADIHRLIISDRYLNEANLLSVALTCKRLYSLFKNNQNAKKCGFRGLLLHAAHTGNINLLEWAKRYKVFDKMNSLCRDAFQKFLTEGGHVQGMKWARDNGFITIEPVSGADTIDRAAYFGHLPLVQWLVSQGLDCHYQAIASGAMDLGGGTPQSKLEVFIWAFQTGLKDPEFTRCEAEVASIRDNVPIVAWLFSQGASLDRINYNASANGSPRVLKWVHEHGVPLHPNFCHFAARENNLELLQWGHAQGQPLTSSVCSAAAERGNLDMLKWARAKGAPWNLQEVRANAENQVHTHVLKWIEENSLND